MKASAVSAATAWKSTSNRMSTPILASRDALAAGDISRKGGASGAKTSRGCGSKVTTPRGVPGLRARSMTCRWPRWTPSKLPMAAEAPRRASGMAAGSRITSIPRGVAAPPPRRKRTLAMNGRMGDVERRRGYSLMVKPPAFQAGYVGSIPSTRSTPPSRPSATVRRPRSARRRGLAYLQVSTDAAAARSGETADGRHSARNRSRATGPRRIAPGRNDLTGWDR